MLSMIRTAGRNATLLLLTAALAALSASCDFPGIAGFELRIVNATKIAATVSVTGGDQITPLSLAAGESQWIHLTRPRQGEGVLTFAAQDTNGSVFFCRRYTRRELESAGDVVTITVGASSGCN